MKLNNKEIEALKQHLKNKENRGKLRINNSNFYLGYFLEIRFAVNVIFE